MKNNLLSILVFTITFQINAQNNDQEGKLVSVDYSFGLNDISYCNFYEYKIDENTFLDNTKLRALKQGFEEDGFYKDENSPGNYLKIKSLLSLRWKDNIETLICYSVIKDNESENNLIYSTEKHLETINNIDLVLKLSNDAFWEFYNNKDNSNYPEINKLKPLVKDDGGILNIEKLAQVLNDNKSPLQKYLDE